MQSNSPQKADADLPASQAPAEERWESDEQTVITRFLRTLRGHGSDQHTLIRLASHAAIVVVVVGLLAISQMRLPRWEIARRDLLPEPPTPTPAVVTQLAAARGGGLASMSSMARLAVPFTTIPDRPRLDIVTYVVQPGDTVFGIAANFGLRPETIMWSNKDLELNPDLLRVNDQLTILPVDGVYHQIKEGDTVSSIAKKYKVDPSAIVNYPLNNPSGGELALVLGSYVVVPGGEKPFVPRVVSVYNGPVPAGAAKGTGAFVWPVGGQLTQNYWGGHRAIDIGSYVGNGVVASDSGYVIYAGWDNTGYGNLVIIDHGNGYETYYAHLSKILVRVGESVGQGQRIGSVGNTGNSTGPHLHFEVRYGGVPRNPFGFLR